MKYRKKPIVIEAEQFTKVDNPPNGVYRAPRSLFPRTHWLIDTLEGTHIVKPLDWIITGVKGEKYPCKPDIFEMTYEKVEEETP